MKKTKSHFKKTALASALLLELASGAQAANIAVDGTTCTLPDAITAANSDAMTGGCTAGGGDDVLDLNVAGNLITLNAGLPPINSNVTINGNGTTINRDGGAPAFRIFTIYSGGFNAVLNDLTISGGEATYNDGGGIFSGVDTLLEINNSTITGNNGGGIFMIDNGPSSINHSVVSNNNGNAQSYYGAGVNLISGYLDINNSTISGNNNAATTSGGGGIYVTDIAGPVTLGISNSTISGNTSVNSGGGIFSNSYGNGIELNLNNATVTLNDSQGNGGGIFNSGGDVAVSQTLVSGNTAATADQWEAGGGAYVTVDGYNIFGQSSTSGLVGVTPGSTDLVPTEAVSGIFDSNLVDNGGPTPTHNLIEGGPAVDFIPNCLFSTDQTLKPRPQDGDVDGINHCDVGAVELLNSDVIFLNGFNNEFW